MKDLDRYQVQALIERGAQVVEVLGREEYEEDHLPGAINIPLRRIEVEASKKLDRNAPVALYCWDSAWDLSPRAAWRLDSLGFAEVYDYTDGKLDWLAAGLPTEGTNGSRPRAGDVARQDVPTCGIDEQVREVRRKVSERGWDACVVVNQERIVFGLLRAEELANERDERVEDVMRRGPSTFRPHVPISELAHYMIHHELASAPITTSDGRLVGLLTLEDAADAAHGSHTHDVPNEDSSWLSGRTLRSDVIAAAQRRRFAPSVSGRDAMNRCVTAACGWPFGRSSHSRMITEDELDAAV